MAEWNPVCQPDAGPSVYVLWVLLSCVAIFNLTLGIYVIRKMISNKTTPLDKLYVIICACFMISGPSYIYHIGQSLYCLSDFYTWMIVGIYPSALYMIGLSSLYLLYLLRLRSVFHETEYALSTFIFIVFVALFFAQIAFTCLLAYFFLLNQWSHALNCYNSFLLLNFTSNGLMLLTFSRKIYHLGLGLMESQNTDEIISKTISTTAPSKTTSTAEEQLKLHLKLKKLLTPSIRYIICASGAMISSNVLSALGFYRSEFRDNQMLWIVHLFLMRVDELINMICLYLQYHFADKRYRKCCGKFHQHIYGQVMKKIKSIDPSQECSDEEVHDVHDITLLQETAPETRNNLKEIRVKTDTANDVERTTNSVTSEPTYYETTTTDGALPPLRLNRNEITPMNLTNTFTTSKYI